MSADHPPDILALEAALEANERDARSLAAELTENLGTWRSEPGSWSVAECLDHLATANRVYVHAMQAPAERAVAQQRMRRGPAQPGLIRWLVRPDVRTAGQNHVQRQSASSHPPADLTRPG